MGHGTQDDMGRWTEAEADVHYYRRASSGLDLRKIRLEQLGW